MEHSSFRWFKASPSQLPRVGSNEPDELIYDESFEKYLSDTTCMSSSGIRKILKSPQHFLAEIAGFLEEDDEPEKKHFTFGRAVHMMILEPAKFRELYIVAPEFVGMTKDGRPSTQSKEAIDKKKAWYADLPPSAEVVTQTDLDTMLYMVDALLAHPQASGLLREGRPEVTGRFVHRTTGVRCRIRPDYLTIAKDGIYISDIKTSRDPSASIFATDMARHRYHVQLSLYRDGIAQILGKQVEAVAFIAMEKTPPYTVNVHWMNDEDLELGRMWYEHGLRTYKRCLELDQWPPSQINGSMINLPNWSKLEALPDFQFKEESNGGQANEDTSVLQQRGQID